MIALVNALLTDSTVSGMVAARIYPTRMPDLTICTFPLIVYTVISAVTMNTLNGDTSGMEEMVIQVDSYSRNYAEAVTLAAAVHAVIGTSRTNSGFRGWRKNRMDLYEDDTLLHRVSMDFTIFKDATS